MRLWMDFEHIIELKNNMFELNKDLKNFFFNYDNLYVFVSFIIFKFIFFLQKIQY